MAAHSTTQCLRYPPSSSLIDSCNALLPLLYYRIYSSLLNPSAEVMRACHSPHGTADVQEENAEETELAVNVCPYIQIRLLTSLLKLLSCEIPLGEHTIGHLSFGPTTPRFQTLIQGLCLLATSILVWERSSSCQKIPATAALPLHVAKGQQLMSESSSQIQEQWRKREFALSFCYKSLLLLVGPVFLKLLRGESAVGSVITGW